MKLIKIEITEEEQQFLMNKLLEEMNEIQKTKSRYNVVDRNSENARYFYDSFFKMDEFVHSIYNKLNKAGG